MKRSLHILSILALVFTLSAGFNIHQNSNGPVTAKKDAPAVGLNVGDKAPELNFKSPSGANIALSSLKGKMVLIDFWASWCRPCRDENPNVVQVFHKFKDAKFKNGKGFTIYGVSLDRYEANWKAAIEQDKLVWENHVSDLKSWTSEAAQIYNVRSIPYNYLIDGNGIIVAKGLRGGMLENTLLQYLHK